MKIYFFDFKRVLKYILIAVILLIVVVLIISSINRIAVQAYTSERELPIYSVECAGKKAAITFDCAWGADDIPRILSTLDKEDVKATFFIVGQWAEKNPDIVRMIALKGHDIANHSYSHLRMGIMDKNRISNEIELCGSKLEELTNKKVELFRAPYGDYSNNVVSAAHALGYYTIQWNVDSLDWKPGISREEIMTRIYNKISPGSIILFHNDTPHTADILPDIIKTLKDKGYELLPVSQLLIRDDYIIDYEGRQKRSIKN